MYTYINKFLEELNYGPECLCSVWFVQVCCISKYYITEKPGQAGGQTEEALVPSRLDLRVGKITKVEKVNISNESEDFTYIVINTVDSLLLVDMLVCRISMVKL